MVEELKTTKDRPLYFIEQLGAKPPEPTLTVDNANVANSKRYQAPPKEDPRRILQDEIARKLTANIHFATDYFQEHYPNNRQKCYSYRQPFACPEIIELFIRQQFRSPLTLLGKFEKQCFTQENFPLAWNLIHMLANKSDFEILHCFLAHAEDSPRDVILRENRAYVRYAAHIQRQLTDIPSDCHRLFVVCELPDMLCPNATQKLLLSIDVREGYNVCGLVKVQFTDPERFPAFSLHQELEALARRSTGRVEMQFLGVTPRRLATVWLQQSKKLFRWRHRSTKRIDRAVVAYSQMTNGMDPSSLSVECRLHEIWHIHQLSVMVAHWLYQRQHICSHADSMWLLRNWLKARLHRSSCDFLNTAYHDGSYMNSKKFLELSRAVYADMISSIVC